MVKQMQLKFSKRRVFVRCGIAIRGNGIFR
nr:MAG TPA: hypothetical protein [Caudoviricetes sp.]